MANVKTHFYKKHKMEKIEENELKKDDLKRKHGWFDWHLYPEEPIKIESMVEILCFSVIVSICAFLYYRWNIVPQKLNWW